MRLLVALASCCILGCGDNNAPPLVADDVEVTAPVPGRSMSAGYMTLTNNSVDDIVVTHVSSNAFERVEIHESSIEDGIARMRRIPQLIIPAGKSVRLQRGGLHLMLMRRTGDTAGLTLDLFSEERLLLSVSASLAGEVR